MDQQASTYTQMEDQHASLPPTSMFASRGPVSSDSTQYERPTGINIGTIAMYFSIALMLLTVATAIAGMAAVVSILTVMVRGGGGIAAVNTGYLANLIAFLTIFLGAAGITFELRLELVLSRVPIMATYFGRAGYYFFVALICLGLAGDLGIATAAMLFFNSACHVGLGYMARRQARPRGGTGPDNADQVWRAFRCWEAQFIFGVALVISCEFEYKMTEAAMSELDSLLNELDMNINVKPKVASPPAQPLVDKAPPVQPAPVAAPMKPAEPEQPAPRAVAPANEASVCARCQQELDGTYIQALDKFWHPTCFTCTKCSKPFEGNFYEHDNGVVCQDCANQMFRCAECGQAITGSHLVFDDGRVVHPTCVQSKPCGRCEKPIPLNESHTEALDRVWHHECFVCNRCRGPLAGQFIQLENQPYCKSCIPALEREKNIKIQVN